MPGDGGAQAEASKSPFRQATGLVSVLPKGEVPFDVTSDGHAFVWDTSDSAATASLGGRVLRWQSGPGATPQTVARAGSSKVTINDEVVSGDDLYWRELTAGPANCGAEPGDCSMWRILHRRGTGRVTEVAASQQAVPRVLQPRLLVSFDGDVVFQASATMASTAEVWRVGTDEHGSTTLRLLARNIDPDSLTVSDCAYVSIKGRAMAIEIRRWKQLARPDGNGLSGPVFVNHALAYVSRSPDGIQLKIRAGTSNRTLSIASDLYDDFFIDARHLLLYEPGQLSLLNVFDPQAQPQPLPGSPIVGAAVHPGPHGVTYATQDGDVTTLHLVPAG